METKRWKLIGAVLVVFGTLFTLQGLGLVGGSAMTGVTLWVVLGPIIAVAGAVLLVIDKRRSPPAEREPHRESDAGEEGPSSEHSAHRS